MGPALLALYATALSPVTIYASPRGSDDAAGTMASPVQTLAQAIKLVRAVRQNSTPDPAKIEMASGDYPVSETIRLNAADSFLTVHGQPGTRIFAGTKFTDWKTLADPAIANRIPAEARSHILVCDISSDPVLSQEKPGDEIESFDLVFNHAPMRLAQWPNDGGFVTTGPLQDGQTFQFPSERISKWQSGEDGWAAGYWKADYVQDLNRVDLSRTGTVQLIGKLGSGLAENRRFFFLNVLEELDAPGEFYFDRASHKIYFYPPGDIAGKEIFVERQKSSILGINECSHLFIENVSLEGGRGSAASIEGGDHVVFERCNIKAFGGSGLTFLHSRSSGVVRCNLDGLGTYGIYLDAGDRKALIAGDDFAEDNRIFNYARWKRTYQPAVLIAGVGNRASHNEIHDAPHNAILLSGNDHVVENNDIYHVCTEAGDAGAIYEGRDPSYRGLIVRWNRFRDIKPTYFRTHEFLDVVSVYLDDRLGGASVYGNVFEGPGMGVLVGGGRDNLIKNNLFVGKTIAVRVDQRGKTWAAGKDQEIYVAKAKEALSWNPVYQQRYPQLLSMLTDDPTSARDNVVASNVSVGATETFLHLEDGLIPDQVGNEGNVVLRSGTLQDAIANEPAGFPPIDLKAIGPRAGN